MTGLFCTCPWLLDSLQGWGRDSVGKKYSHAHQRSASVNAPTVCSILCWPTFTDMSKSILLTLLTVFNISCGSCRQSGQSLFPPFAGSAKEVVENPERWSWHFTEKFRLLSLQARRKWEAFLITRGCTYCSGIEFRIIWLWNWLRHETKCSSHKSSLILNWASNLMKQIVNKSKAANVMIRFGAWSLGVFTFCL